MERCGHSPWIGGFFSILNNLLNCVVQSTCNCKLLLMTPCTICGRLSSLCCGVGAGGAAPVSVKAGGGVECIWRRLFRRSSFFVLRIWIVLQPHQTRGTRAAGGQRRPGAKKTLPETNVCGPLDKVSGPRPPLSVWGRENQKKQKNGVPSFHSRLLPPPPAVVPRNIDDLFESLLSGVLLPLCEAAHGICLCIVLSSLWGEGGNDATREEVRPSSPSEAAQIQQAGSGRKGKWKMEKREKGGEKGEGGV